MISLVDDQSAHDLSRARFARLRPARFARGLAAHRNAAVLALQCGGPCAPIAPVPLPLPLVGGLGGRAGSPRRFARLRPARFARGLAAHRNAAVLALQCGGPCAPIAPVPLPLPLVGGLGGRAGLPRRFAPPLPRRVALPLRGLLWRPAPSWAPLWRPLSLAAVLAPKALAVSAGHPRSLRERGLAAPSPVLTPAGGALLPLSPLSCGSLAKGYRTEKARKPARYTPAHSPCPLARPAGEKRLGHYLSATAQKKPVSQPATPPPTPPAPSHAPRGKSG